VESVDSQEGGDPSNLPSDEDQRCHEYFREAVNQDDMFARNRNQASVIGQEGDPFARIKDLAETEPKIEQRYSDAQDYWGEKTYCLFHFIIPMRKTIGGRKLIVFSILSF
jgi:hypothetical protein